MPLIARSVLRVSPYVLLGLVLVYGMLVSFPADDDVLLEYLVALYGPDQMYHGHLERPISGIIWATLARADALWWPQVVANFFSWLILGGVSTWLFQYLFPDYRRVALAAGMFTMSPLFIETHFIIANAYIPIHAFSQLPIILLLKDWRTATSRYLALIFSLISVFVTATISEYAVSATAGTCVLLLAKAYFSKDAAKRRQALVAMVLLGLAAIVAYGVFVSIRDPNFREGVDSTTLLTDGLSRYIKIPFRLLSAFFTATAGALFRELAEININSKETILACLFGLLISLVGIAAIRLPAARSVTRFRPFCGYEWIALLAAFSMALMPALLMGRRPDDFSFSSRFFTPTLPMAAALTVLFVKHVIAGHKDWVVVAIIGFIAGYGSLAQANDARNLRLEMAHWGEIIRPHVEEDGMTVALFLLGRERFPGYFLADDLLTSRLSIDWPLELRKRFYASNSLDEVGPSESSDRRGAKFLYPVTRVLLVMPRGTGQGLAITEVDLDHLPKAMLDINRDRRAPPPW